MASTKATDRIITALWSALEGHGITSADGVRIEVVGTGGGCEALEVSFPGGVIAITDGDLGAPADAPADEAVRFTDEQWNGDADGYERILPDADMATVAVEVARFMDTDGE